LPGKFVFSYGTTMHSTLQQFMQLTSQKSHSHQADLFGGLNRHAESINQVQGMLDSASNTETLKQVQGDDSGADIGVPLNDLFSLYEKNWLDDWYDDEHQKKKYKQKGKTALKNFYTQLSENTIPNVKALERSFKLRVGEYTIIGKMDRVDICPSEKKDISVRIVDYKTGSVPKNGKLSLADKRQLLIYQIAAEEVFREKVEKLIYYYLDQGEQIEFVGTEKEKQEVREWIIETIEKIKSHNFSVNPKQHFCDYCDEFRDFG